MSLFRDPPQSDMRATSMAAVRNHYIDRLFAEFPDNPEVIAETLFMDNEQLRAYCELMLIGNSHHWTAANLIQRVPHEHLRECVRQLVAVR